MRDWECCVKRVQANERDKRGCGCIQCAGGVSVSEATSEPHFPASFSGVLRYRRRIYIFIYIFIEEEGNNLPQCNCWKREVEDLEESFLGPGVSPSPPLPVLTTRRARCGVGLEI